MSKIHFAKAAGAWTALASALALLAMPAQARPYDGQEGGGRQGGSGVAQAQSQGGGAVQQQGGGNQGNWRGRGGDGGMRSGNGGMRSGGGEWRGRSVEQRGAHQGAVSQGSGNVQQGWSRGNGGGWRARQSAGENQAASQGWQQRNRSYADPDRNRTYRDRAAQPQAGQAEAWRQRESRRAAEQRRDNREQRQTWRQGWREGVRDGQRVENWRDRQNDGNWRNDGRRGDNWRSDDRRGDNWRNDRRYSGDRTAHRWNRDWRRDRRYDWNSYRSHNRDVYRIGRYYAPYHSHRYSRLSIGIFLGSAFYANRYWIDDPWMYRLPAVYGPYRWVRYYDDALLVDIYTGEVVDVIYDFFW